MIKKLRFKFVAVNMSIVLIMLCIILGLVYHFTKANLEAQSIAMMQNIALHPLQIRIPDERGENVRLPYFTIQLGPRGEFLATGGGYYDLSNNDFLDGLVQAAFASPKALGVIEEYNLRYYRAETPLSRCIVFADISSELATLGSLTKTCLFIGALSALLFLGVSILLSKWAVKPVDLAWQQQRQFVTDASHELKTPLTVIMTNAELAQSPEYSEESRRQFLSSILSISRQMGALVEQMLELARADSNSAPVFSTVDLSAIVDAALLPFEPVFFEKGLSLKVSIEENIFISGGEGQLRRLVEIFLDNAQKYTLPRGTAWVSLKRWGESRCLLEVSNQGTPISPQEAEHIFKRFYRGDQARSRTGSFGLGLAIAQSIAAQHHGKIGVESSGNINRFYVEFPCRPQQRP